MATTTAKFEDKNVTKVARGASGGNAPEGYGAPDLVTGHKHIKEGVATRSKEEEEKLHKEADAFMKSKVDFDKKVVEGNKEVAAGHFDKNPVKDALDEQHKKQEAEAAKKPTAAGVNTNLDSAAVAQSAKETAKEEKKEVAEVKKADDAKVEPKKVDEVKKEGK